MEQYISKSALVAEIERRILEDYNTGDVEMDEVAQGVLASLKYYIEDILKAKEVNIAEMADEYYDALMEEAAVWMDEGTMGHCRLAYYNGCKDVLNKIRKGE